MRLPWLRHFFGRCVARVQLLRPVMIVIGALGVLATCDTVTGPRNRPIVLRYAGDTAVIAGTAFTPEVVVTVGGAPYPNPRIVYHSSDTTILALSAHGDSLRAKQLGTVTLTMQLVSSVLSSAPPTLKKTFIVQPKSVSFGVTTVTLGSLNDTTTIPAVAYDQTDTPIPGVTFTWTSTDTTIVKVNGRGQLSARANGTVTVHAVVESDTAALSVTVQQKLAQFVLTPLLPVTLTAVGADTTLSASARDSLGNVMGGAAAAPTWQLKSIGIVAIAQNGQVHALANGTTYVYATSGAVRDSLQVSVNQQATRIVVTAPTGFGIPAVNGTITLTLASFDRNNNPVTNATPNLTSLDPQIAQVNSTTRVVTAIASGTARIVASEDAVADTVQVMVTNLPTKLVLSTHAAAMASVGDTLHLGVTFTNALGGVVTGPTPGWYSSDTTICTVSPTGAVVAVRTGAVRVIATLNTLADTAIVTVTNAPATLVILARLDTIYSLGDTLAIPVNFRNARGVSLPASAATWSSDNPAIVSVSTSGTVTAVALGRVYVHAVSGILRDSALVAVVNQAASITLNSVLDTMTARGQMLKYTASVKNGAGTPIAGATVTWTSSTPTVASVDTAGLVTALAVGTTTITATSGRVHANVTVVVRTPTLLYVDNSTLDTLFFGTLKRPYLRIQDGVNAAVPGDTVFVRVGVGPYSETVALSRDIVLQGDPTAYLANGRDPTKLPLLSHDTGAAGITAFTTARVTIRTLAIRHTLDGLAIDARHPAVQIVAVYVNPSGDPFNSGRGISVDSTTAAVVDSCGVKNVRGFGIHLQTTSNATVLLNSVTGVVAADPSTSGAGIDVFYGSNNQVIANTIRTVAGPQILMDSTAGATIANNVVAGQAQLMRVVGATGSTQVTGNSFNTRAQAGDPNTGNSQTDGRSGLEINASPGVLVFANTFTDNPGTTSLMDAVHVINTRGGGTTTLQSNGFHGGRYGVWTSQSTWTMQFSRSDSAAVGVVLTNADSVTLATDTLDNATTNCVQGTGNNVKLLVTNGYYTGCGPQGNAAIEFNAFKAVVDILNATFQGFGMRAAEVNNGHHALASGNTMIGGSPGGPVFGAPTAGVMDLEADSVIITHNTVTGYPAFSAAAIDGGVMRVDSNFMTRNREGINVTSVTGFEASFNDIFDNDTVGVVNNQGASITVTKNWWGDGRGPRRSATPAATGDSADGPTTFSPFNAGPLNAGNRASALRLVRGNGQSATRGTTLPQAFTVRVIDVSGKPVSGVNVTFRVTGGGGTFGGSSSTTVASNASGLAEATLTLGASAGANTVQVTSAGLTTLTVTATAQ